jgi:opacity protein-like surface antigen
MRKLAMVLFAIGGLCLMAFPAFAAKGDMAFGVNGGVVVPIGALADDVDLTAEEGIGGFQGKMGFDFGASFDYFLTPEFAVGLDGSYASFESDYEDAGDAKATTMQFGVHGKYLFPTGGPVVPYVAVGAGMYTAKLADVGMEDDLDQTKFGMNGGVGLEYMVTPQVGIGVGGTYHYAFGEFKPEIEGQEVTVLDDWNYMTFNAAVTFHFPMAK